MNPTHLRKKLSVVALAAAGIIATLPALADPPPWAGGDKGEKHERRDRGRDEHRDGDRQDERGREESRDRGGRSGRGYFEDHHRMVVHDYYTERYRGRRHCPPGLAKKHNGCVPPGLARRWEIGRPLPREVVYYDLPPPMVAELGPPPSGHRFVRVAGDILLVAIGTGMVMDAIEDLGSR